MTGAQAIIRRLGGHWRGRYGMARCPCHRDRTPSLKVSDGLYGEPILHCFGGCGWRDVKDSLRRGGLLPEWPGDNGHDREKKAPLSREIVKRRDAADRADKARRTRQALRIWRRCVPAPGTLVETYLRARGITIPVPPSIRFLPDARHKPTGLNLPAMVAGVQDHAGRVVAIHRTFLSLDGTAKAGVREPRMSLGPVAGAAVRLARANGRVAVSEGVETGLSILQATGIPTWAALSATNMASVILPPDIRNVILGPDGDEAGALGTQEAAKRLVREGREVRIARPPLGQDFNDLLIRSKKWNNQASAA